MPSRMKHEGSLNLGVFGNIAASLCGRVHVPYDAGGISFPYPSYFISVRMLSSSAAESIRSFSRSCSRGSALTSHKWNSKLQECLHEATEVPQHHRASHDEERVKSLRDSSPQADGSCYVLSVSNTVVLHDSNILVKSTVAGRCRAISMESSATRIEEKIKAEAEIDEYEEGEDLTGIEMVRSCIPTDC